jgi:transcriptional regulator with XRE-family HTH domain
LNDTILNPDPGAMPFGRYLKSMRTQMGISIEAVAREMRISERQLSFIEAEEHQQLPDVVYVKGLLRTYAKFIGVDANDIVDRYAINRAAYEKKQTTDTKFFNYNKKVLSRLFVSAGLLIIIIVFSVYMIYGFQANSLHSAEKIQKEKIDYNTSEAAEELKCDSFAPNQNGKLFLQIDAVENTSLKIIVDDSEPLEYLLHPMDHIELEAFSKINLLVSNAAGVMVLLNEKPVCIPGKSGDAAQIELPQKK